MDGQRRKNALISRVRQASGDIADKEMVYVAIAFNCGQADLNKDFRQGYFDGKYYYGEYIWKYLQLAHTVQ